MINFLFNRFFISKISSIELNCNYKIFNNFQAVDENQLYICNVTNLDNFSNTREKVEKFTGQHVGNMKDSNVQGLMIRFSESLKYPPINVDKFFTTLTYISFFGSKVCELLQSDLKPFPFLKYLYLTMNELKTIDQNLFEFNTNLELITLDRNKIFFIDPKVFSKLKKLRYLDLGNNTCKLQNEYGMNATFVKIVISEIENFTCTPAVQNVEKAILKFEHKFEEVENKLSENEEKHKRLVDYLMISFAVVTVGLFFVLIIVIILVIRQKTNFDDEINLNDFEMNENVNDNINDSFDDVTYDQIPNFTTDSFNNCVYDANFNKNAQNNSRVRCTVR
ncbi:hypothetical protein PVAND_016779 [Polypedilum vanderplanki]|uniref:Uncharacterized protein n=1 Tax=Polypedilum vanderplanki TaxID=319348 RepID=A0A9J6BG48_POLVA|nr:hypothetical protein PVAND_016779 [Polypedilum vanderplanki]